MCKGRGLGRETRNEAGERVNGLKWEWGGGMWRWDWEREKERKYCIRTGYQETIQSYRELHLQRVKELHQLGSLASTLQIQKENDREG